MSLPAFLRPAWLPDGTDLASRWGRLLVWVGAMVLVAGMFNKPPLMNAGLGLGLAGLLLLRSPVWRMPVVWIGVAFSLWVVLSTVAAWLRDQPEAGRIQGPAYGWLALPIVAVAAMDAAWRRMAFKLILGVAGCAVIVAALQWSIGAGSGGWLNIDPDGKVFKRACGLNSMSLVYGFVSAILVLAAASPGDIWGATRRWRWCALAFGVAGLVLSGTRGAILGVVAGLGAMIMARGRKWVIAGLLVFCGLMGLALLTLSMLSERRFQQMMAGENGRWPIWGATLVMIGDHPLLGVGGRKAWTAAYPEAYQRSGTTVPNEFAKSDGRAAHAHNTVLAIAAEYGTPAAVLHIALIVCVLVVVWRRRQESPGGWQLACGIASLGFVAGSFEPYPVQSVGGLAFHAWLGLALGVALAASEERKSQDALPSA